jgi:hypothetical protein
MITVPGHYVLDQDVENPDPSPRHYKAPTAVAVWKKGTRFRTIGTDIIYFADPDAVTGHRTLPGPEYKIHRGDDRGRFAVLEPALRLTEEAWESWAAHIELPKHAAGILEKLVADGRLTRADITALIGEDGA